MSASLAPRRGAGRLRAVAAVAAPVALGGLVGLVLAVLRPDSWLELGLWLPAAPLVLGAVLTCLVLGAAVVRRREAVLRRRLAREARAEHARFLARLDHELKNPLTAISVSVAELPGSERQAAVLRSQTERLTGLLTDLRRLAQIESAPLEATAVDLVETVTDAVEAVEEETRAGGGEARVATSFPSAPWHLPSVTGDPDLLYMAVHNVLANAVKYGAPGAPVEVRGHVDGASVVVEVADSGIGIPAADQALVWDELGRAGNVRGLPGSGIGLSLVRTVVARHGGTARLTSQEGVGTLVRLELPAAE